MCLLFWASLARRGFVSMRGVPVSLQALVRQGSKGGYISALAVADGFRGRGVAKVLMAAAVEQIERDGATASQLVVRTH